MPSPGLLALVLLGAAGPSLETVRGQVGDLQFSAAARSLAQLGKTEGFSKAEALEFFTLEGLVKGALNDAAGAKRSFTRALMIDPTLKLPSGLAPRVSTPFLEAKALILEGGSHALNAPSQRRVGEGWELAFQPPADPSGVVEYVVFSCVEDGVSRQVEVAAKSVGAVVLTGFQVSVTWKLLDARRWVLHEGGPFSIERPRPVGAATTLPDSRPPPAAAVQNLEKRPAPFPIAPGVVLLSVGGVASLVSLALFGAAGTYAQSARDAMDLNALTLALDRGRNDQTIGGVLLSSGLVLIGGGVALLGVSVSSGSATRVSFMPMVGGGVAVLEGAF